MNQTNIHTFTFIHTLLDVVEDDDDDDHSANLYNVPNNYATRFNA